MMCLVLSVMAFAQTGVDFQHLTFDEALAKAKAEKKLVFVDCYTTWCGPCKMMTTKIFPMKEAGEFFNPRFVCVKFDMKKDMNDLKRLVYDLMQNEPQRETETTEPTTSLVLRNLYDHEPGQFTPSPSPTLLNPREDHIQDTEAVIEESFSIE